jgi:Spy/CpxP family protein refolding chaperone
MTEVNQVQTEPRKARWPRITVFVLGAITLCVVVAAGAFPGRGSMGPPGFMLHGGGAMRMMHMMQELDLSGEQRDSIATIMDETMPRARELGFALMDDHKALREIAVAEDFDDDAAEGITADIGENVAALTLLTTRSAAEMRAVLTAEQRLRFDELREQGKHHRKHGKRWRHRSRDGSRDGSGDGPGDRSNYREDNGHHDADN